MADDGWGNKVPGKWKDSLPVINDKVVAALEKGIDVPIEAMVSGAAMEHLEDRLNASKAPIHYEDLTPVMKGDPRIQPPRLNGVDLPKVPQMRRVIPPPFQRPRLDISHTTRKWTRTRADQVQCDDIVVDIGKVMDVAHRTEHKLRSELLPAGTGGPDTMVAVGDLVILTGMGGIRKAFAPSAVLRVFTEQDEAAQVAGT
jgi:hypothetical protein